MRRWMRKCHSSHRAMAMPPLQRSCPLLLLALLGLCLSLSQAAGELSPPKGPAPSNSTTSSGLSAACGSPPLLSMALGVAAALLLQLR